MVDTDEFARILLETYQRMQSVIGLYCDADAGLIHYSVKISDIQEQVLKLNPGLTKDTLDRTALTYGVGHPADPNSLGHHKVSQGELKQRNAKGGTNHSLLSDAVIGLIYSLWNDEFRPKLAKSIDLKTNDISSDIFGDIRHIRNSIVHHGGVALPDIKKCKIICCYNQGIRIFVDTNVMVQILFEINKSLDELSEKYLGTKIGFSTKYNAFGRLEE